MRLSIAGVASIAGDTSLVYLFMYRLRQQHGKTAGKDQHLCGVIEFSVEEQ